MPPELAETVAAVRDFTRFYTRKVGALDETHLGSAFTLGEARVLHELAQCSGQSAKRLGEALDLDAGYLSRILRRFEDTGLIARTPDPADGRSTRLELTAAGRDGFETLNRATVARWSEMLSSLSDSQRADVASAMALVRGALDPQADRAARAAAVTLREPAPGDLGWVVERHAVLYGREYGWGPVFEAVVAEMAAQLVRALQQPGARGWIAELEGRRVGCVFCVPEPEAPGVARLRLLLLEPEARGLKLGQRLTDECLAFARAEGYREMVLWTHTVLTTARAIYASRGFVLEESHFHADFGPEIESESWRLVL
ncbi:bifunctional helix-turn-helix transcriptional regulator/GNAT family N-acetyltransferase [Caulobacter sp. KR2-114]|uniref:bifunctional helix-turn-helix transcriptional regulator/GNAT family N-acetyltransferase n=1 Tax=Caulobacter sp. KR2-114 TaxID=3400912 RepID=UPI003C088AF8